MGERRPAEEGREGRGRERDGWFRKKFEGVMSFMTQHLVAKTGK